MSNNEKPKSGNTTVEIKNYLKTLPSELQGKVNYLIDNPTAKVIKLSDPQRGSTSNQLYGLITNIDLVKPILTDVLNFKIDLKDPSKFFEHYGEYGKTYKEVIELLKKLENLGIDLLKNIDNKQNIRNKRLRDRVFQKDENTQTKVTAITKAKVTAKAKVEKKIKVEETKEEKLEVKNTTKNDEKK